MVSAGGLKSLKTMLLVVVDPVRCRCSGCSRHPPFGRCLLTPNGHPVSRIVSHLPYPTWLVSDAALDESSRHPRALMQAADQHQDVLAVRNVDRDDVVRQE